MELWEFKPLEYIGRIRFGMKRVEVRAIMLEVYPDITYSEFIKSPFSLNTTDDYKLCHVHYSMEDQVEAVEVFKGIEVVMEGKRIFPMEISQIDDLFPGIVNDGDYYYHKGLSVGLGCEDGQVESVLFGKQGYYDQIDLP